MLKLYQSSLIYLYSLNIYKYVPIKKFVFLYKIIYKIPIKFQKTHKFQVFLSGENPKKAFEYVNER